MEFYSCDYTGTDGYHHCPYAADDDYTDCSICRGIRVDLNPDTSVEVFPEDI